VDFVSHQVIRSFQQFAGENHDACRAVADFAILEVGELDQNL
tara:strand:+ start:8343 stop:8468 length:126 start_codon:yes stop_codon:yes gene_type:complete